MKSRIILVIAIVAALILVFVLHRVNTGTTAETDQFTQSSVQNEEVAAEDPTNSKVVIINKNDESDKNASEGNGVEPESISDVIPVIVFAGIENSIVEASAYVPVVQQGICKIVVSDQNNNAVESKDFPTSSGASTTDCGVMSVDVSNLSAGTITLRVEYVSSTSTGTSQPMELSYE